MADAYGARSRLANGRSINYESNGVRCIIGLAGGLERRGNGSDRPVDREEAARRSRDRRGRGGEEGRRGESNPKRNSDRYLWKLTEFQVNRARATGTLVSRRDARVCVEVHAKYV